MLVICVALYYSCCIKYNFHFVILIWGLGSQTTPIKFKKKYVRVYQSLKFGNELKYEVYSL